MPALVRGAAEDVELEEAVEAEGDLGRVLVRRDGGT